MFFIGVLHSLQIYYILLNFGYRLKVHSLAWNTISFASYSSLALNPFMYAWQYEAVRGSARTLLQRAGGLAHDEPATSAHEVRQQQASDANVVSPFIHLPNAREACVGTSGPRRLPCSSAYPTS